MLTAGPDRRQHDARGTAYNVGQGRVGPALHRDRGVPTRRGHQIDQPPQRDQLAARGQHLQRRRVAGQPVIQRGLDSDVRLGAKPFHDSGREDLFEIVVRGCMAISASTGARPAIPAYNESRSSAGASSCGSSGTDAGSHGPSSSATWLTTHVHAASPRSRYASPDAMCPRLRRPIRPEDAARERLGPKRTVLAGCTRRRVGRLVSLHGTLLPR